MASESMIAIARQFRLPEGEITAEAFGNGQINHTWLITVRTAEGEKLFTLQEVNTAVFTRPVELMSNVVAVTTWIRKKIEQSGGDPLRETLNFLQAKDGNYFIRTADHGFFRMYHYVDQARAYDQATPALFRESARAFGQFQAQLSDFPAETLFASIPDFHNTEKRYEQLMTAIREDKAGRASSVQDLIAFATARKEFASREMRLLREGALPLRVTHNDTKLNNVLIDDATGKGLCVIDLDTVMPGLSAHDFGDAIRFGANFVVEDDPHYEKAGLDLSLFEAYVDGFMEGVGKALTEKEIRELPWGARMMTYECGIRFLADYLNGDTYFHTRYPEHNLDRTRTQFAYLADLERHEADMDAVIEKYL